ncbi:cubilin-like isoform X2 [Colossoma macropomum]|uniref:cubilin-like isoform X2 n=1 Tax=Colossoma macropomum TaxID=42526 RepID=UPI001864D839|nr:cubilin-like isoform X2 [Colossoma macropomum]
MGKMKLGMIILPLLVGVSSGVGASCGGDLTNPGGEFFSPQYPNNYPNDADCTWRLLASETQVVNLTFTFVDLENCCDSIRVYDGPSNSYPLLGRLPQDERYRFSSTRNSLTVVLSSDSSVTGQGFWAQWVFSVGAPCGGDLTNPRGEFFSLQYPNNYPNNADCTWRLLASETQVVNLTFTFVELETCCDSIRVYDGPSAAYPLLDHLPKDQRHQFSSTRNSLTIVFSSDRSVTRQGFRAQWEFAVGTSCGEDLTNPRGEFFSPQYPNYYPHNAYCTWRLLASETQVVNLTFTFVDLEACCDSIRVYDGPTDASPLLGRLPQDQRYHFNSSRNYLTVVFSSDHSFTHQGFQAQWVFPVGASCGEDLTNSRGEFFSPQYPNNYPNYAYCTWRLLASETQVVNLTLTFVELETCCDSIRVYDGPSAAYPLLVPLLQDQKHQFSSTRNSLTIVFKSDRSVTRQGFRAQWEFAVGASCGEDLTNSRGEFFSPQYPNNYPNNADCTWRLLASETQVVNLTFTFVELEECCDSIRVYDGPTAAYPLLGRLPQDQRHHFSSTRNSLTVVFSSDLGITGQGFRGQWVFPVESPCGGDLTNSRGEFFSPQYPNNYPNNAHCTWRLLASETRVVNLTFTFVELETCCDSIRVYDGPSAAYPLLGRLPNDQRHQFNSTRNSLTIVFSSDRSVTRQGFRAQWEFPVGASCGEDLTNPRGEFFSPQYPNNYPNNAHCTWRLLASETQVVNLTFTFVDLEACCDSIRVYDGPTAAYPLLGRLPQDQRHHFSSTRNSLTVVFSSDLGVTGQGFRAQWVFPVESPCGGDLTNSRGEFFSLQYPNNYPNNAHCTWRLLASETRVVNLTFTFVDVETCCDSIRVYDGPSAAYPLLGHLPQDQRHHFNSTRNSLTIVFSSDHSITHQGFRAQWEFPVGASCGEDLTNSRGEFFSPWYPNNYPNNADCTWRLLASETQVVNLTFTFVDLEACCDSIRVYDGPTDAYPLLGRLPQDQRYHFNSSRNYLTVVFSSDHSFTHQGFQAQWVFPVESLCGGDLTNLSGEFFRFQYPNKYHNNAYCTWRLRAPVFQVVNITFTFVDLEKCCDSIGVYDGPNNTYPLLGRLPQDQKQNFISTRNSLTVVFSSDSSVTGQGFRAQWEFPVEPCGGDLTNPRGEFFSPRYPNNYPNNADCTWRLLASDRRVNLTFTFVELEECCDSLRVYDGPTDDYPLLGRLPQDQKQNFISTRNSLTVVFSSDSSVTGQGFQAQWEFSDKAPWGEDLTNSSGEFFSPQYPNNYPNNADCTWRLLASETQFVNLTFTFVNVEECCDSIRVYDGPTDSYPLLGRLPKDQRYHFKSTRNYLTIVFSSDSSVTRQGFQAQWVFSEATPEPSAVPPEPSTEPPNPTSASPSCRWNCGSHLGRCSCSSSCQYYGNCCHDYYDYCYTIIPTPDTPEETTEITTTDSCRLNCGYDLDSCSCASSCQYYRDCCHDYYDFCHVTVATPNVNPTVGAPCGGDLTNSSGEFFSPQYPNKYPNNANCTWRLLASERQAVNVTFMFVDLEVCCDSIRVYEGPTDASPLLGRLPQDQRHHFSSTRSSLTVVFSSDSCINHQGFRAQWVFSEPTTEPTTVPPSTEPPTPTSASPSCRWNCGSNFDSCSCSSSCKYYRDCCHDYYDFCHVLAITPKVKTTVHSGTGAPCGGNLTKPRGEFFSPQYPNNYPNKADCTWRVLAPKRQVIKLAFTLVDVEECCDSIRVYDGPSASSPLLGRLPQDQRKRFSSTRNSLTVVFSSDNCINHQGFRAEWEFPEPTTEPTTEPPTTTTELTTKPTSEPPTPTTDCCQVSTRTPPTKRPDSSARPTKRKPKRKKPKKPKHKDPNPKHKGNLISKNWNPFFAQLGFSFSLLIPAFPLFTFPLSLLASIFSLFIHSSNPTDSPSCKSYCGSNFGSCSCANSCQSKGNCCHDYHDYCHTYTTTPPDRTTDFHHVTTTNVNPTVGPPCGGDLTNSRGEFYSPQYPNNYPDDADCTWRLLASEREVVNLIFTFVDLEECCDSIMVYDGPNDTYPLLGDLPQDQRNHFNSTRNSLTVVLSTDHTVTGQGFRAQWVFSELAVSCRWNCGYNLGSCSCASSCQDYGNCCHDYYDFCQVTATTPTVNPTVGPPCGGDLTNSSGEFFSPQYPNNYPNNADCTWRLLASERKVVNLTFIFVDLEACCDFIRVYDGPNDTYPLLGRLPQDQRYHFNSSRNSLTVVFSTDQTVTGQGFWAQWVFSEPTTEPTTVPPSTEPPTPTSASPSCRWNCGSNFDSCSCASSCQYYGNCCSDYYDFCHVTATTPTVNPTESHPSPSAVPPESTIDPSSPTSAPPSCRLNCGSHLGSCSCSSSCQYYGNCCHDYHDYCDATTPAPATTTVGAPCGGDLTNSRGEFFSPQYPNNYPNNADCTWRLLASERETVNLTFTFVDLERCCDSIRVYDGPTDAYPLLGRLPQDQRSHFSSTRNSLTVVFSSDSSVTRQGFRAQWVFSESHLSPSTVPPESSTDRSSPTSASPSCRWNCGSHLGSCSCSSSCQYYGNCCHDYHDYCYPSTPAPDTGYIFCAQKEGPGVLWNICIFQQIIMFLCIWVLYWSSRDPLWT